MTPKLKKFKISFFIVMIITSGSLKAQDFGTIIAAGQEDANTYLENYIRPGINSLGNGLANGWYNTAKAHKTLGFDLTATVSIAKIPVSERTFEFLLNDYQNITLTGDSDGFLPTLVGGKAEEDSKFVVDADQDIYYNGQPIELQDDVEFPVPGGIDIKDIPVVTGVPTPTFTLGIGIYKNTDLRIRYLPEIQVDDFKMKMFGIGVMHDIKQWIPGVKNLPFDLSGFFGTTKVTTTINLEVDNTQSGDLSTTTFSGTGKGEFISSATTIQALISKKLTVFTPYAGIGVNIVGSSLKVLGDYTYEVDPTVGSTQTYDIKDPIDLSFQNAGGPRFTIGGRLKLAIFTFHFDYTLQKYSTVSGGFGIAIR